ncbi:glycosyltransferase [Candidatus Clostridium radicumherbarum]|uniref:Glycosyltransferase n=1 Tax=Candidatus Clostridium radicumherbarum TaxID=3381662 RepID=A0ABW8TPX0_9CLOT
MRILHYSLGLPPYRTGGLTKYAFDLMKEQVNEGKDIYLLYPGHIKLLNKQIKIHLKKQQFGIKVYELINPLPVPLLSGIGQPSSFCINVSKNVYISFLKKLNPDIIHLHTLMGLHKEFFIACRELNIKIIFTTHDYFGICPKVNLFDFNNCLCTDYKKGESCTKCNEASYSLKLIFIMQLRLYKSLTSYKFFNKMKHYLKNRLSKKAGWKTLKPNHPLNEYSELRKYYLEIFKLINYFHYNSSVSKEEYEKYISCTGEIINITHNEIKDNRKVKIYNNNSSKLRITYLGSTEAYKGFSLLTLALDELKRQNICNWELTVYSQKKEGADPNYIFKGTYKYQELEDIFNNTDILIIPSAWKETFGYIGLEAFSFGVPVMVTENVGFKDILINNVTGIIVDPIIKELAENIAKVIKDRNILEKINRNIIKDKYDFSLKSHSEKMFKLYDKVLEGRC